MVSLDRSDFLFNGSVPAVTQEEKYLRWLGHYRAICRRLKNKRLSPKKRPRLEELREILNKKLTGVLPA